VAGLRLGLTTDTQDSTGTTLTETPCSVTTQQLEEALEAFRGEILQVPPMYSALKVNGKKLYELARKGKEVERKPRPITIHKLEVVEQVDECTWIIRVGCSKGTYIRTLCHDIGQALGTGGIMCSLRRTEAAGFTLDQAVTMDQVIAAAEAGRAQELLLPVERYFHQYPRTDISGEAERRCRNGNEFLCDVADGTWRVYGEENKFLMLGQCENGTMKTVKSFFEV
jgi:tRNA pseudouridine55 synthase